MPEQSTSSDPYGDAFSQAFSAEEEAMRDASNPMDVIGTDLLAELEHVRILRKEIELRWLMDLRQYRGQYEPEELKLMAGRSQAFMRKTRVKVESVDARMLDLLFPASRERNYDVCATPEPTLPRPLAEKIKTLLTKAAGGKAPQPDALKAAIKAAADAAAAKMASRIDDQLAECKYRDVARAVLHSGHLYGTGILKGPLVERRERVSYAWQEEEGKQGRFVQSIESFVAPFLSAVPVWRFYPDMHVTALEDARFTWEHHRLSRAKLAELASRKTFNSSRIRNHIETAPDGCIQVQAYEQVLHSMGDQEAAIVTVAKSGQYDVYERWGWLTAEQLVACGAEIKAEDMHEAYFSNVWILPDGTVIRAVLSPIDGVRWPYHIYYLDHDETGFFGEGLAAIMRDNQRMLNSAARMILDNAAITAGDQYEVFVPAFPPGTNFTDIYPGKVWPRTGGDPQYPAIRPVSANAHIGELTGILQLFDSDADEVTAIPKFTYGDNPQNGAAATMGGLSMLMAQANIALKDFVASWDEGVTKPFISALYHWNMKFCADDSIKGDYDVVATGASSLVAKEMRAQALTQFAATLQPEQRPYIKWADLTQQHADVLDLSNVVMTKEEAQQQQSSPEFKQQQEMQQMQLQLQLALAKAKLAVTQAQAGKIDADALNRRMEAMYAAMQAAGIAMQQPGVARAADSALQSGGWVDATPAQPGTGFDPQNAQGQQPAQTPDLGPDEGRTPENMEQDGARPAQTQEAVPASPHLGQRAGIETQEIGN